MTGGYYQMHRGWLDHHALQGEPFDRRSAWCWLVEEAQWQGRRCQIGGHFVELKRGQLSHSTRFMARAWGWSEARVRRFVTRLKIDAMIDADSDAGQLVITLCNYDRYQTTPGETDAPCDAGSDAAATQTKERKKRKKRREGADAPRRYAFEGKVIRLTESDFTAWAASYSAIVDLRAALQKRDDWLARLSASDSRRKDWYVPTSNWLANENERHLAGSSQRVAAI